MIYQEITGNEVLLGVDLNGKTITVGRVRKMKLEKTITRKINNKESEDVVLKEISHVINELFDKDIVGIGIGVPSVVDVKQGIVYKVANIPSWRKVHLRDILENKLGVKVYVNNDANCFAIGEKYFGQAVEYNNVIGIIIGIGFGAGIVFNGHLYSGSHCGAGEFGSIPYKEFDYEYYCSEGYFEEKYGIKAEVFYQRASEGDKIALAVFEQFGYDLGTAIKSILFAVDPDYVVLGGSLSKSFPFFKNSMWEKVMTYPYKYALENFKIEPSNNPDIAVLGAAALYLDAQNKYLRK